MSRASGDVTEAQWQATVLDVAGFGGWLAYHTHDSRRSQKGFPDLVLVRDRVLFVELKTDAKASKLTRDQQRWLGALDRAGAEVHVWRPSNYDAVVRILQGRTRPSEA